LLRSDFVYWALITFLGRWLQNAAGFVPKGYHLTPDHQALIRRIMLGNLPASPRADGMVFESYDIDAEYKASITPASPYPLDKIETPLLVIHALDDPIISFQNVCALAKQMPNARLCAISDGGHFFFGHAEEVKAEIAQFLRGLTEKSPI
jgi:pimeloyl-ACP methyl ester carboxylesterase